MSCTALGVGSLPPTFSVLDVDSAKVAFQNGMPVPSFERQSDRTIFDLGGTWKKNRVSPDHDLSLTDRAMSLGGIEAEGGGRHTVGYNDSGWPDKALPAVENTMCSYEDEAGPEMYEDGVWYRRHFTADSSWNGKYVKLNFFAVNYICDVWINGQYVGYHEGGYSPFAFNVGTNLNYGADNVIAIRVDNIPMKRLPEFGGDNGPGDSRNDIVPYAEVDWFNYTGVLGDVFLEISEATGIVRADVKPLDTDGNLNVKVVAFNSGAAAVNAAVEVEIYDAYVNSGNITNMHAESIAASRVAGPFSQSLTMTARQTRAAVFTPTIPEPRLWEPAKPHLYVLKATLKQNGVPVEEFYTQFGVRTLEVSEAKLLLNGEVAPYLAGTGRTEDSPYKGRSMTVDYIYNDLNIIRNDLNCNFIHHSHGANHVFTGILADRIGLAAYEQLPTTWMKQTQFDTQRTQRFIAKQMWREMIFKAYNRPSVWFRGACNECEETTPRYNFITDLKNAAVEVDGTRLVAQSAVCDPSDSTQNACDVLGYNMYFGVFYDYYGGGGDQTPEEFYNHTLLTLDDIHANFSDKPVLITEYGFWDMPGAWTEEEQESCFTNTFKAFAERAQRQADGTVLTNGFVCGSAWWCAFNWYTPHTGIQTMGLMHMDRTTKKPVTDVLAEGYLPYSSYPPLTETLRGTPFAWIDSHYTSNKYEDIDASDTDGDGMATWQEYIAGTNPNDASSVLQLGIDMPSLGFDTVSGKTYRIEYLNGFGDTNGWKSLSEFTATQEVVDVEDPGSTNQPVRVYRVIVNP